MKKYVVLCTMFKDGSKEYSRRFEYNSILTEKLAITWLLNVDAEEALEDHDAQKVQLQWWLGKPDYDESSMVKAVPLNKRYYKKLIPFTKVEAFLPEITGDYLVIFPDTSENKELEEVVEEFLNKPEHHKWAYTTHQFESDNQDFWGFYGDLWQFVGSTQGTIFNAREEGLTMPHVFGNLIENLMYFTGIRKCKVIGVDKECLGFFRAGEENAEDCGLWSQEGCVVFADSVEDVAYAYYCYLMNDFPFTY